MSNEAKLIRKQLRNVCQELLKDTLSVEMMNAIELKLKKHVDERLDRIDAHMKDVEKNIKETIGEIEKRSKDVQNYLIREVTGKAVHVRSTKDGA